MSETTAVTPSPAAEPGLAGVPPSPAPEPGRAIEPSPQPAEPSPAPEPGRRPTGIAGDTVLRIDRLSLAIKTETALKPILHDIELRVERGIIQGLAGESGSGKTMTGLAVMGLEPPGSVIEGRIWLGDTDLAGLRGRSLANIRGRRIGMVFQDPSTSLHPQLTIGAQLTDHVRYHLKANKAEARERAIAGLERVGVPGPAAALSRYPHEFSGGQRQRIAIAIALACDPELLIADEPTTALDVTVQAGVLALIRQLVDDLGLAVIFITHDLGVMSAVADRVAIMRYGRIVEAGGRAQIFHQPAHPYTRSLLAALPGAQGGLNSRDDLKKIRLDSAEPEVEEVADA